MLLRLAYLGVTNVFALLRLLPRSDRDTDAEILVLRHQLTVLQRQLGDQRIRFQPADRYGVPIVSQARDLGIVRGMPSDAIVEMNAFKSGDAVPERVQVMSSDC